jgi:hypothetical protein
LRLRSLFDTTTAADRLLFLILFLLSISGLFFIRKILPEKQTVLIDADGKPAYILPLGEDRTVSVKGPKGTTVVEIRNNMVRVTDSPCPNKLCVKQGWITSGAVVCLPNKVAVTISGNDGNNRGIDAITR